MSLPALTRLSWITAFKFRKGSRLKAHQGSQVAAPPPDGIPGPLGVVEGLFVPDAPCPEVPEAPPRLEPPVEVVPVDEPLPEEPEPLPPPGGVESVGPL